MKNMPKKFKQNERKLKKIIDNRKKTKPNSTGKKIRPENVQDHPETQNTG